MNGFFKFLPAEVNVLVLNKLDNKSASNARLVDKNWAAFIDSEKLLNCDLPTLKNEVRKSNRLAKLVLSTPELLEKLPTSFVIDLCKEKREIADFVFYRHLHGSFHGYELCKLALIDDCFAKSILNDPHLFKKLSGNDLCRMASKSESIANYLLLDIDPTSPLSGFVIKELCSLYPSTGEYILEKESLYNRVVWNCRYIRDIVKYEHINQIAPIFKTIIESSQEELWAKEEQYNEYFIAQHSQYLDVHEKKQEKVSIKSREIDQDSIQEFYKQQLDKKSINAVELNDDNEDMCDEYFSDFSDNEFMDEQEYDFSEGYSTEDDMEEATGFTSGYRN